jgi:dipeptidyl-peptidase-4
MLLVAAGSAPAAAAPQLSFGRIFTPAPPWGTQPSRIAWSPDASSFLYVLPMQEASTPLAVRQYDLHTGVSRVLIDPAKYGNRGASAFAWSPDGRSIAYSVGDALYVRDMSTGFDRLVARGTGDFLWSPQSSAIAYTREANLYVADLSGPLHSFEITQDGKADSILDGSLDWVYPEELGTAHGFAWSPDGKSLAYMRMDERRVTPYPIVDFLKKDGAVTYQRYPLAGESNPRVALYVADLATRSVKLLYDAGTHDEYLPFFGWKPDSNDLIAELIDRSQKHLRVVAWDGAAKPLKTLYGQSGADWVDVIPLPLWLSGGNSLWLLDRSGSAGENTAGLFLRNIRGNLRRLTGPYHVFQLYGADEKAGVAFVSAAYPTRRDRSLLAVPIAGGAAADLTPAPGTHVVSVAPTWRYFVDTASTLNAPPQTTLADASGARIAVLAPRDDTLAHELLPEQMLDVPSAYGNLDAYVIRPGGFDPARRYPVVVYVYGGPAAPTTTDVFGGTRELYFQMLARAGFIVFSIDGPASQLDDDAHVRLLYHNFGPGSLLGQEIGAAYLRSLPYVDGSRIGIWGWSFGGYEAAYALTHSNSFKAGISSSPVTDWHLYDTIYTERYMGMPQQNSAAYDASSVLTAAKDLRGDLLMTHGTADDNVHMANTISLLGAFISAGKTNVDFMAFPGERHGFTALADLRSVYEHMFAWWQAHL